MNLSRLLKRSGLAFALLCAGAIVGIYADLLPGRTWYCVRGLCRATDESDRNAWLGRLRGANPDSLLALLCDRLHSSDRIVCENAQKALEELAARDDEADRVLLGLADEFTKLSCSGQLVAVRVFSTLCRRSSNPSRTEHPQRIDDRLVGHAARLLEAAARSEEPGVRAEALALATELLEQSNPAELREASRSLVRACLGDGATETRLVAVRLAMRPDIDLHEHVASLLSDPNPEVRRVVMLVVGPAPEAVSTDELLRWLHDPDEDVRKLCETALRGRGLQESHLRLGKHLTDATPRTRMKVLDLLSQSNDLDPSAWLRRLSHDPSPAVRAAALRAGMETSQINMRDRVVQMAQTDPSPTVRQLAQYYLGAQQAESR